MREPTKKSTYILCVLLGLFFLLSLWAMLFPDRPDYDGMVRSSSLQLVTEDATVESTIPGITMRQGVSTDTYKSADGTVTYAADKMYASVRRTTTGNVVLEEYFDENGKPAKQSYGHYAIRKECNEEPKNMHVTYLDEDGKPMMTTMGFSSLVKLYDSEGRLEVERSFDLDGHFVETKYNAYGFRRTYDEAGRVLTTTYMAADGSLMLNKSGYAVLKYYYDEPATTSESGTEPSVTTEPGTDPSVTSEPGTDPSVTTAPGTASQPGGTKTTETTTTPDATKQPDSASQSASSNQADTDAQNPASEKPSRLEFFDTEMKPIALIHGEYGVQRGYDEFGRITETTYLDRDGNPLMIPEGYATIKRTFYEDDSIRTDMYFDAEGQPVELPQGQYGVLHEGDMLTYLDRDGNEVFSFKNFLHNQPWLVMAAALVVILISLFFGKRVNICLLIGYLAVIIYMTLLDRSEGSAGARLQLFQSYVRFFSDYTVRKETIDNIWLFIPLGTILYQLRPRLTPAIGNAGGVGNVGAVGAAGYVGSASQASAPPLLPILIILFIPLLLSGMIEVIQYLFRIGTFELDDVFSNTLGGAIGVAVAYVFTARRCTDQPDMLSYDKGGHSAYES
ncbi:MAG: VanZ family protein [Eubacterium sp.]|nr:VanZ family protein [Eubacterium sp.]